MENCITNAGLEQIKEVAGQAIQRDKSMIYEHVFTPVQLTFSSTIHGADCTRIITEIYKVYFKSDSDIVSSEIYPL